LKRIATILLLGMLLFNWIGYRFFTSYLEEKSDARLEAQLDNNNYDESQLISIKVPVSHLAYYNSSAKFERVDGQIEINGVKYKYVKSRLYNDSLELLCIPNIASMQLQNVKSDFFKIANDLQNNSQNKKGNSHSIHKDFSVSVYSSNEISYENELSFSILKRISNYNFYFPSPFISKPKQPPQIS